MLSGFSQSKCLEHLGTAGNKVLFGVMGQKEASSHWKLNPGLLA